jgi:hypothetical protein
MALQIRDLADLFLIGLSNVQCRELCEAHCGYKVSRIHVYPFQLEPVHAWCRCQDLSLLLSDFGVLEYIEEEGKGTWCNLGRRVKPDQGVRYCYIGRNRADVNLAKEADMADDGDLVLADLFKIPRCCAEFFIANKAEAIHTFADDYAVLTQRKTQLLPPYAWPVNYLAQYFGYSLIHHYPCQWDCQSTLQRSSVSLEIVKSISVDWMNAFYENMWGIVVFENLVSVHIIRGCYSGNRMTFTSSDVRSTNSSAIGRTLRKSGWIEWISPYEFTSGDVEITSGAGSSTIIIPFA